VSQNRRDDKNDMRHASRSNRLLHVKVSRAKVSKSGLKTGGGAMRMVHVASSRRLRRAEAEDGWIDAMCCVGPFYPNFTVFYVLDIMSILLF
jgi:hypothetical protein